MMSFFRRHMPLAILAGAILWVSAPLNSAVQAHPCPGESDLIRHPCPDEWEHPCPGDELEHPCPGDE